MLKNRLTQEQRHNFKLYFEVVDSVIIFEKNTIKEYLYSFKQKIYFDIKNKYKLYDFITKFGLLLLSSHKSFVFNYYILSIPNNYYFNNKIPLNELINCYINNKFEKTFNFGEGKMYYFEVIKIILKHLDKSINAFTYTKTPSTLINLKKFLEKESIIDEYIYTFNHKIIGGCTKNGIKIINGCEEFLILKIKKKKLEIIRF